MQLRQGAMIGRWRVSQKIGKGGNGIVYEATEGERVAAVKVLNSPKNPKRLARFADEIRAMQTCKSLPGVLPLYESFLPVESDNQPPWLAMPLAVRLVDALGLTPTFEEVIAAIRGVAAALVSVHELNISHRDIKPDNLFHFNGNWVAYFRPYLDDSNRRNFSSMGYGSVLHFFRVSYSGQILSADIRRGLRMIIVSRVKIWLMPKYVVQLIPFQVRWLASLIECLMWGYGERPTRIFLFALFMISAYARIFHGVDWHGKVAPDWIDSLYFSVVTFTTLGYGDILPNTATLKLLCGSEAILGAFTMGLVVAGFSNRSKY
jgi:hypothetical protein